MWQPLYFTLHTVTLHCCAFSPLLYNTTERLNHALYCVMLHTNVLNGYTCMYSSSCTALCYVMLCYVAWQLDSVQHAKAAIAAYNRYLVESDDDPEGEFNLIVSHAR